LTGAARPVAGFRRFLTVIRTRARARAAALEKFIATNNPARGPQQNAFAAAIRVFMLQSNIALQLRDFNTACCSAAMT
jgi:hypothetical protein